MFISFEGGEGSGKTTQIDLLKEKLLNNNNKVLVTREPGGSSGAEKIRKLLVKGKPNRWDPETEALLMFAARRDNFIRSIKPSLDMGEIVISDRYTDSTRVYQGLVGGVGLKKINSLNKIILGNFEPELTILLDIDVDIGLKRVSLRKDQEIRFESKGVKFHNLVRKKYLYLSKLYNNRIIVINALGKKNDISYIISKKINEVFNLSI